MQLQPDFLTVNLGSIVTLTPLSDPAETWCDENLPEDFAGLGAPVAIEGRYFFDIACGLLGDGLTMQDAITGAMATLPEGVQ